MLAPSLPEDSLALCSSTMGLSAQAKLFLTFSRSDLQRLQGVGGALHALLVVRNGAYDQTHQR